MDYEGVVRFAFDWLKEKESLKYLVPYCVLLIISSAISFLLTGVNATVFVPATTQVPPLNQVLNFVLGILFSLIFLYISGLVLVFALKRKNRNPPKFDFSKYIGMIKVIIVSAVFALLWCGNKKLRIVQLACFVVSAISLLAAIILMLGNTGSFFPSLLFFLVLAFAIIVYIPVLIYTSVRYSMSLVVFLDAGLGAVDSANKSWELTRGAVLEMIIASLLAGIVVAIAAGVVSLVVAFFASIIGLPFGIFGAFFAFLMVFSMAFQTLAFIPQQFIEVAIYDNLLNRGRA